MATIPFGRYKGQRLAALPLQYALWVASLDNVRGRYPCFYFALILHLQKRLAAEAAELAMPRRRTLDEIVAGVA